MTKPRGVVIFVTQMITLKQRAHVLTRPQHIIHRIETISMVTKTGGLLATFIMVLLITIISKGTTTVRIVTRLIVITEQIQQIS